MDFQWTLKLMLLVKLKNEMLRNVGRNGQTVSDGYTEVENTLFKATFYL